MNAPNVKAIPKFKNQENSMKIDYLFAAIVVTDLDASENFYTKIIGRPPDDKPMDTLAQWRGVSNAGIQLFKDSAKAGHSMMTIIVSDVEKTAQLLKKEGIVLGKIRKEDTMRIAQLSDPDGNVIFFAEPPKAPVSA